MKKVTAWSRSCDGSWHKIIHDLELWVESYNGSPGYGRGWSVYAADGKECVVSGEARTGRAAKKACRRAALAVFGERTYALYKASLEKKA